MASFSSDFSSHSQIWDEAAWEALHAEFLTPVEQSWGHPDFQKEITQFLALPIIQSTSGPHASAQKHAERREASSNLKIIEKPYQCPECDKVYAHEKNLKRHHLTIHGRELLSQKPSKFAKGFPCPHTDCSSGMSNLHALRIHLRKFHGEELPLYHCPLAGCASKFKDLKWLERHLADNHQ